MNFSMSPNRPTSCATRLRTTGSIALRIPSISDVQGSALCSSAARTAMQRARVAGDLVVVVQPVDGDDDLLTAGHRDVVRGNDRVVGATDRRDVDLVGETAVEQVGHEIRPCSQLLHGLRVRRWVVEVAVHFVGQGTTDADARNFDPAVASGAPWCGVESVTTVSSGGYRSGSSL